jgi:hypothetical protein
MVTRPRSGRLREGRTSTISQTARRVSPGKVGRGQSIRAPAPINPPAIGGP